MRIAVVLCATLLLIGACEGKKFRRVDGNDDDTDNNKDGDKDTDNNKDGDKDQAMTDGAGKSWTIGSCVTRFVCALAASDEAGPDAKDKDTDTDNAMMSMDCFAGGKEWKADQAGCETKCPDGKADPAAKEEAKTAGKTLECEKPDCSKEGTKTHYFCMTECRKDDVKTAEPEICDGVSCQPKDMKHTNGRDDWRCRGGDTTLRRRIAARRIRVRNQMMRRLGRLTKARNYRGMARILRRMDQKGMHTCGRSGIMKYFMYPIAAIKCIVHRLYCVINGDSCAAGNMVTIKEDTDKVDCTDDANADKPDCSQDKDKGTDAADVATCDPGDPVVCLKPCTYKHDKCALYKCWADGGTQAATPDCKTACAANADDYRCIKRP